MLPSATLSSTPVSVTVCATFQFAAVNTRLAGRAVPSAGFEDDSGIVTFATGCELSLTVNVAVPPASVVVRPATGFTVTPETSSSWFVTLTSDGFMPE